MFLIEFGSIINGESYFGLYPQRFLLIRLQFQLNSSALCGILIDVLGFGVDFHWGGRRFRVWPPLIGLRFGIFSKHILFVLPSILLELYCSGYICVLAYDDLGFMFNDIR